MEEIHRIYTWTVMPCHSMGPKWPNHFGRVQIVLVRSNLFWKGPTNNFGQVYLISSWFIWAEIYCRECVSMGARTRRSLGHQLLHPLILRLLVLGAPAVLRHRALQDAPAPADPNS